MRIHCQYKMAVCCFPTKIVQTDTVACTLQKSCTFSGPKFATEYFEHLNKFVTEYFEHLNNILKSLYDIVSAAAFTYNPNVIPQSNYKIVHGSNVTL